MRARSPPQIIDEFSDINCIKETIKKMGRPKKQLNPEEVSDLIRKGHTLKLLSIHFGCHRDTIYTRFSPQIRKGRKMAHRDWLRAIKD